MRGCDIKYLGGKAGGTKCPQGAGMQHLQLGSVGIVMLIPGSGTGCALCWGGGGGCGKVDIVFFCDGGHRAVYERDAWGVSLSLSVMSAYVLHHSQLIICPGCIAVRRKHASSSLSGSVILTILPRNGV